MRETIRPSNEREWLQLRTQDLTSTDAAALFGCSPFLTEFELFHRKKNAVVVELEPTEHMKWGSRLQDAIACGIAQDHGFSLRRKDEYIRIPDQRIGSSFDYEAHYGGPEEFTRIELLEVKNVFGPKFRDEWIFHDDGALEAPPHVEIQVQVEMLVSGITPCLIGALVSGNQVMLTRRTPNPRIQDSFQERAYRFWQRIQRDDPPEPDFRRDADFISELYGHSTKGSVLSLEGDAELKSLAQQYRIAHEAEKFSAENKRAIRAQILMHVRDAEKIYGDGFQISAGMRKAHERKACQVPESRGFLLTWKGEK